MTISKIPPPVQGLCWVLCMWVVSRLLPELNFRFPFQFSAGVLFIGSGLFLDLVSIKSFWGAKTTINPLKPEKTSQLVTSGVYRFSRNPMYLGLALILIGVGLFFGNPINVFLFGLFIASINKVQIQPEEAVLKEKFGDEYIEYSRRVRRWI